MADIILLEIKDIKGNSEVSDFADKITITSFSHSLSLPMQPDRTNRERTAGKPVFSDINLSKMTDMATPALYNACASGKKLGEAKIHIGRNMDGKYMPVLTYTLGDAMISTISTSGGGGIPSDSLTINFTSIKTTFTQQNKDATKKGEAPFGWDLAKNIAA